jgi:PAS domain S-box-containing protein
MLKDPLPYLVLLALTATLSAATAVRLSMTENRHETQYRALLVLFAAVLLWNVTALLNGIGFSPTLSYHFNRASYLAIPVVGAAWFVFALAYSDRGDLVTRRAVALLAVEPVLLNVAVWTNDAHRLVWTLDWARTPIVISGHGPLFWVHAVYMYLLTMAGVVVMIDVVRRRERLFQRQSLVLATGAVLPLVGNAPFLAGWVEVDPTPVTFAASALLYYWAIERTSLGSVSPIARQTVIDTMSAGMFVLDEQNRLVDVNRQGRRLLGVDTDVDVVGRPAGEVLGDRRDVLDRFEGVVQGTETIALDTERGRRYFEIEVSPVTDGGDRVGRLFLVHDVTDRQEREQTLERKNEQLEEFASVVSHDLRNPLSVARGYVQTIEDAAEDPQIEEYAAEAETSHQRMETLIEDILSMAREGATVENPDPLAVAEVARDAWANVESGSARLRTTEAADRATVLGDRDRLQRAFENLFRNSVEHGSTGSRTQSDDTAGTSSGEPSVADAPDDSVDHGGGITVTVGCEIGDETAFVDPEAKTVFVADDGSGIPESERESVLEQGYTTEREGTGFGLAIVEEIAEAHGWSVRVEESESGGARIVFAGVEMPRRVATDGGDD